MTLLFLRTLSIIRTHTPKQESTYHPYHKSSEREEGVGKVKKFIRSHKIQQWRGNPSPAPYSALSKGSKIPNLEVAAQAAARKP
jgi:hypothetical protein